jgi:hypothetical protein
MTVISKHETFGEAIDGMFDRPESELDLAVRHVDGQWCVVREPEAYAAHQRELSDFDRECLSMIGDDQ